MRVMESEHCHGSGVQRYFTTINYRITTCPRLEWKYVVQRVKCPEHQMHGGRRIESVEKLLQDELAVEAKLQHAEVVAVVLYSGPMVRSCACQFEAGRRGKRKLACREGGASCLLS